VIDPPPLPWRALYRACAPDEIVRGAIPSTIGRLGQERALEALEFGLGMRYPDYHVFVLGPSGLGKHATVRSVLEAHAATLPTPADDCYARNFVDERRARWLRVPAGRGSALRDAVAKLVADVSVAIPEALGHEDYRHRRAAIAQRLAARRDEAVAEIRDHAAAKDIVLESTPVGFTLSPVRDGQVVTPETYKAMPAGERAAIDAVTKGIEAQIAAMMLQGPQWLREAREQSSALDREVTERVVARSVEPLVREWAEQPNVLRWFEQLAADVVEHLDDFRDDDDDDDDDDGGAERWRRDARGERYAVNVLVDHGTRRGAPVAYEDNPTLENLVGRIDARADEASTMDVSMILAGALHRVNGGCLVLDASKLVAQPSSWAALKRALFACEIRIESVNQAMGLGRALALDPEPIPLDAKCVLIGDRLHYEVLAATDPEFAQLFKVLAEFEPDVPRTPETTTAFVGLVDALAREHALLAFDNPAVARVVEHAARLAEDAGRLSVELQAVSELLRESNYAAMRAGAGQVGRAHVERALAARWHRNSAVRERVLDELREGAFRVATDGEVIGQVNALTVLAVGEIHFARPNRVTARVRPGRGELVDISRETRLGGPIHSKGVLTLAGFLAGRYFAEGLWGLSASLVFEQSYGHIEGDSASLAELCALVSAIAELPARQSVAVTGSVDQLGHVQAVGDIHEKIEGFFDACCTKGLTGQQGVVIPGACASRLMLRSDVVDAVRDGRFRVWAVDSADEAFEIVFGRVAGTRDVDGRFPLDSINARVEHRLRSFAATLHDFETKSRE